MAEIGVRVFVWSSSGATVRKAVTTPLASALKGGSAPRILDGGVELAQSPGCVHRR